MATCSSWRSSCVDVL
uniref:Uncharacterized protein n=1 Tax=Anguilla anguilla TaxID=7936 RepID=A0A0E9U3Q8_ANGAN